jgi:SAM-dependent methyltransferase
MSPFDARQYWESRLTERYNIEGVGFIGLGTHFNNWMYRIRRAVFLAMLRPLRLPMAQLDVLDIGAGTGFYIDIWRRLGVKSLTGVDLTQTAVDHLRQRYPEDTFVRADIGEEILPLTPRSYDVISACDVLFHLVDDNAYARAIRNIATLLKPGGTFLFTELFLHGPAYRGESQVCRSLATIEELVQEQGLEIVTRRPVFYLMTTPLDSDNRLHYFFWRVLSALLQRSHALGYLLGACLYPLERLIVSLLREGPTMEIMVCRKPA